MVSQKTADGAARLVSGGASMLSASVLADSAIEHYRGSFSNPAMIIPIASSAVSTVVNGRRALGHFEGPRPRRLGNRLPIRVARRLLGRSTRSGKPSHPASPAWITHIAAALISLAGTAFHIFNIGKRPGGFRLTNLFYKAPVGAPAALGLAGVLGTAAEALQSGSPRTVGSYGRKIAAVTAAGLAGTSSEAALLHFRGAYHNPAMWLPVSLPPVAAVFLIRDSLSGKPSRSSFVALGATAVLGLAGSALHIFGVSRNMGGWRNWHQNLLVGPPIPAPPAFTALAIAGIGALLMMRKGKEDG